MKSIKKLSMLYAFLIMAISIILLSGTFLWVGNIVREYTNVESAIHNPNLDQFEGGGGGGGSGSESEPTINADLTITTFDQFKTFVSNVRSGTTYEGKTVALGANISGGEIEPIGFYHYNYVSNTVSQEFITSKSFNGTFDGQGYKISNLTIKGMGYCNERFSFNGSTRQGSHSYTIRTAMFANLGASARVQNLSLSNISYGGGVEIDQSGAPYVTYSISQSAYAIFTDCNASATFNCVQVDGTSKFTSFGNGSAKVTNCDLRNSKGMGYGVKCTTSIFRPQSGYTCTKPFGDGSTYCHSTSNKADGFSYDAVGGSSGTTWYYATEYSSWPLLRCVLTRAIGWKTVAFTKGSGVSSFSPTTIKIPNDATKTFSSSTEKITIYGQNVIATISPCHATISWSSSSATSYTCTATAKTCNVNFCLDDKIELYASGIKISNEFKIMQASVSCGTQITCTYEKYTNGKIKTVSFSFKDASGTSYTVKYVAVSKFYIEKYNRAYTNNTPVNEATIHSETYIKVHDNIDISISTKLKTYDAEVK